MLEQASGKATVMGEAGDGELSFVYFVHHLQGIDALHIFNVIPWGSHRMKKKKTVSLCTVIENNKLKLT